MLSKDDVMAALAAIPGPDGRTPLPQSGAIDGVTIRDGKVFLAIKGEPARASAMEGLRSAVESKIKALPGVTSALVTLTAQAAPGAARPAPPEAPRPAGRGSRPIEGVQKIIAGASGKGGVGKSTTACNLALGLSKLGLRVGVLDADLFGPSMPRLFGITEKPTLAPDGKGLIPITKFGIKVMSIGFLVVDMPPGTGDVQLTMAQNVPLAGAVIVSTPQDLSLIDARRGIAMFRQVQAPLLGIVENMSYFQCPHCGGRTDVFAHGGARHEAEKQGVPFLGEIPLDIMIRETSDGGALMTTGEGVPRCRR